MTNVTSKHALKSLARSVANARVRYFEARRAFLVVAHVHVYTTRCVYDGSLRRALEARREYYSLCRRLSVLRTYEVVPYGGRRS